MAEIEYIAELWKRWPSDRSSPEPTPETIQITQDAVEKYPHSAKLWVMRGNLLELINFECDIPLNEAAKCYRHAIKADSSFIEAYEDMGYFLDAVMANPRKARQFFDKARRLRKASKKLPENTGV